jgi:dimeric dUTPase (all-alpha-NTP-PPase superfamily)
LATSLDELVNKLEAAVKMRVGERKELNRTREGRCWSTKHQVYEEIIRVEYSDGTSELVWGETDE